MAEMTLTDRLGACSAKVNIKGQRFEGAIIDVRCTVRAWIDDNGYGVSDIGGRWRVVGHPLVKAISYNGRLWDGNGQEVVMS